MLTKTVPANISTSSDEGSFEAIVATYDLDSVGDKIVPGAFGKSLADWKASGRPVPIVWSHQHADPFAHIGEAVDIAERDGEGLWVKGQLDMDNPTARQVHRLMKGRRVDNFSFAYDVLDAAPEDDGAGEKSGVMLLKELKLFEVGPTLIGANQDTRTLAVKADKAETVSDTPWSQFSTADYSDEQWTRATVLDRGADAGTAKQRYALPVREPDGTLNRNGVHAAAASLAGARGGVQAPAEAKTAAARKLVRLYGTLGEDAPESVMSMAKDRTDVALKVGRVLSSKNEEDLRAAHEAIGRVLAQLSATTETQGDGKSTQPAAPANATPDEAAAEEPIQTGPAQRLLAELELLGFDVEVPA